MGLQAGGTLCIYLCRNVIKNLKKTLMKTNFSPGLTKLWQNWPTSRRLETRKKTRRTTAPGRRAAKEKAKENRCLQLLPRNTRNPAAAAVKLQKCNYKTLFGLHTHTHINLCECGACRFPAMKKSGKITKITKRKKREREREPCKSWQRGRTYRKASAPHGQPSNVLNPFAHG